MSPASLTLLAALASASAGDTASVVYRPPVTATGDVAPAALDAMHERIDAQLARSGFDGLAPDDTAVCGTAQCWSEQARVHGAAYQLDMQVDASQADQQLTLRITHVADGATILEEVKTCELCGRDELLDAADDLAATGLRKLKAHDTVTTTLVIDSDPLGAMVSIDGTPVGTTPLELRVEPGAHALEVSTEGYEAQAQSLDVERGTTEKLRFRLVEDAPAPRLAQPPDAQRRRVRIIAGAGLVATGVAATAAGVTLLVLHGRPITSDCSAGHVDLDGDCEFLHDTRTGGAIALAAGGAAVVTGSVLLGLELTRGRPSHVSLHPAGSGLIVRGRF